MNTATRPAPSPLNTPHRQRAPAAARTVLRVLTALQIGRLEMRLPDGSLRHFGAAEGTAAPLRAQIRIDDWAVFGAALRRGDIGFAEAFIAGQWSSPDPVALLRLLLANRDALERLVFGSWWGSLASRLRHLLNRNSRSGSRRNIHAHYDIGNDFYRLWLDKTMNYSSALFEGDETRSLEQAQHAKVARALRECGLKPGGRLLEIGCGWGAVAEAAARDLGAKVVGVTLSDEQLAWARERLEGQGLNADLRLQDYRDIADGPFDAIVSIEMFEAVGQEYWGDYFAQLKRQLKPGGRACVQSITIRDDLFDRYRRSTDFIQQYIFPGGLLPSPSAFRAEAERAGLVVERAHAFGPDYARTLRHWRAAFERHEPAVRAQGFDTRFVRIWDFYLAYSQAAFDTGNTNVMQFTLRRP